MSDRPLTVGRLARRFGLSRSTLLYYDSIGLLRPSARSGSNYREYSPEDAERLAQVCQYRSAGVPLVEIRGILDHRGDRVAAVLERRFTQLNREIARLRAQQEVILRILRRASPRRVRALDRKQWTALLRAAGLDDEGMRSWHREFERLSPHAHQDFLESLRIPPLDVRRIRAWSRARAPGASGRPPVDPAGRARRR